MKKLSVFVRVHLWLILLCLSAFAQDFKTVQDGVEYAEVTRAIDGQPVRMNLLRLDLRRVRLDVVHAMDAAIGTETVSSMATRRGALAAINAGFFRLDKSIFAGDAAGVLQIDGRLLSESINNRTAIFIANKPDQTKVSFAALDVGEIFKIKKKGFRFSGINRQRKDNEVIKLTPEFSKTTLTDDGGLEIVVRDGKIAEIHVGTGNNPIPQNGYVISASGEMSEQILPLIKLDKKIKLGGVTAFKISDRFPNAESGHTTRAYLAAEDITNGVPQLIKNGVIDITWEREKSSKSFVETRHPRTAVAKLKDGKFLMVTVDGRSEASGGIGLQNLAEFLLGQGATDAMNLDGGGSSTMFLSGKVVNRPSDKEGERKVSDAILVFPRRKN